MGGGDVAFGDWGLDNFLFFKANVFIRERAFQFEWYKMDRVGVIDDLGGLLCEVKNYCGDDIFLVIDSRVLKEDMVNGQKIFVLFALDSCKKTLEMEKFLNKHDFLFLMTDDEQLTDYY